MRRQKSLESNASMSKARDDDYDARSNNSAILPPLGGHSTRKIKLRPFIIAPYDHRYRAWESFLVLLVFYTAWMSPFEFGFLQKPTKISSILDNVVNGFFGITIVLTFFVAYVDKTSTFLVDSPKLIALKYAKKWLILDVISTVPYEFIEYVVPKRINLYGYISLLRLWRIKRVNDMFQRLEKDRNIDYLGVRLARLTWVTLFSIHCAACIFYLMGDRYKQWNRSWFELSPEDFAEISLWDKYVVSVYWSIVTAATLGYGDLHPVTTKEMAFDVVYLFYVFALSSYIIGNITNLIVQTTYRTRKFRDTIHGAMSFARRNHLPARLQEQITAHLTLKFRIDSEGVQQQETIDTLPKAIRTSISHFLFYSIVNRVYLFRGVSNDLLFQLVSEMKPEYFPPREDVILQNDAPTDLYILVNGAVDLISHMNGVDRFIMELKKERVFGEVGLLCYRPHVFTARTKRLSQLLRLSRTSLFNCLQNNAADGTIIMNNLLEHLKEHNEPVMHEILRHTEQMLAHGMTDLPLNLCFAAARGDDQLLHHLLSQGLDPNELDSNGRTPLHLAASKGSLECVSLLLEYGADPNRTDSEGKVPLWDALLGDHKLVIKALVDNKATLASGDAGQFAHFAAAQNNIDLLKEIIKHGGDVTMWSNLEESAMHEAISNGNIEIVEFLLENGFDIDTKPDESEMTPRAFAEHQGNEEIKALIQSKPKSENQNTSGKEKKLLMRKDGEQPMSPTGRGFHSELSLSSKFLHRRPSMLQNSLAGIITAGQKQTRGGKSVIRPVINQRTQQSHHPRVTITCPEKGDTAGKMVLLPGSIEELQDLCLQKYGFRPAKILTRNGYLVEDLTLIRDNDQLVLAGNGKSSTSTSPSTSEEQ